MCGRFTQKYTWAEIHELSQQRGRWGMARKRFTTEQLIGMLREEEVRLALGQTIGLICKGLGISEQSYYRRRDYGGLKLDQAKA